MYAAAGLDVLRDHAHGRIALAHPALGCPAVDPGELRAVRREFRLVAVADMLGLGIGEFGQVDAAVGVVNKSPVAHLAAQPIKVGGTPFVLRPSRRRKRDNGRRKENSCSLRARCLRAYVLHRIPRASVQP